MCTGFYTTFCGVPTVAQEDTSGAQDAPGSQDAKDAPGAEEAAPAARDAWEDAHDVQDAQVPPHRPPRPDGHSDLHEATLTAIFGAGES